MKFLIGIFFIFFFISIFHPLEAYQRLNKHNRAYYYTQPRPYWNQPTTQWDHNAYKSYFYYDHEVYPQYTYVYPGHYYYYGYPYYYNNDNGRIYSYWGY
jgi:hypothetical protein